MTNAGTPATNPPRPPGSTVAGESRRPFSTRVRLLGWYIALMGLALVVGLLVQRTILLSQLDRDVGAQLRQEIAELDRLVDGNNPETGEPFADDVRAIFDTFLSRNIPQQGEALFTLIDGRPHASTVTPLQLLDNPELVERWRRIQTAVEEEFETEAGRVRTLAVPVEGEEGITGTFVVAFFLEERLSDVNEIVRTGLIVFGSVFLLASTLSWFAAGRVLRPITELTVAARSINDSNLTDRIEVEGDDQIAQLGRTFNSMLDRLEAAFETQRRLVDDVGHELRTPITIIRGHLELLPDEPTERNETLRLVMDELDRMGRMVEDLLLLAKAEQNDFLHLQPVDLDELTEDIAAKASALGDREWVVEEAAPVVIQADRQRLTQAMMNLCRNAVEHTSDGTPVRIGSRVEGDTAYLWVADDGEGIDPADHQRIFERFARGVGARRSEGAGLGLAIVAAIAEAHGGAVRVDSAPNAGATFELAFPTATADLDEPWGEWDTQEVAT